MSLTNEFTVLLTYKHALIFHVHKFYASLYIFSSSPFCNVATKISFYINSEQRANIVNNVFEFGQYETAKQVIFQ